MCGLEIIAQMRQWSSVQRMDGSFTPVKVSFAFPFLVASFSPQQFMNLKRPQIFTFDCKFLCINWRYHCMSLYNLFNFLYGSLLGACSLRLSALLCAQLIL